jgi:hypothetical protein
LAAVDIRPQRDYWRLQHFPSQLVRLLNNQRYKTQKKFQLSDNNTYLLLLDLGSWTDDLAGCVDVQPEQDYDFSLPSPGLVRRLINHNYRTTAAFAALGKLGTLIEKINIVTCYRLFLSSIQTNVL